MSNDKSINPPEVSGDKLGLSQSYIGKYRIERILVQMGPLRSYLAHDEQHQRQVVIRTFGPLTAENVTTFLVEAEMIAKLHHPNIVSVYEAGNTNECPCFIVSQYVEGVRLSEWMKINLVSPDEAVRLTIAMAEALYYIHRRGVIHRNVQPESIFIGDGDMPLIGEFGLPEACETEARQAAMPAYISPEQARGEDHRVDARSDIFSLGSVFYELLTRRQPFIGESQDALLEDIRSAEPAPPRLRDPKIPEELERICLKALSKRTSERYDTAKDLAEDLRHWLNPDQGKDIFLSHATPDKDTAEKLCRLIEERGVRCWIAPRDILPGDNYAEAIVSAIERTTITVLLLSSHSNASIHVMHEIERATSKRKRVVPVRLENVLPDKSLELHLSTVQWLDFDSRCPDDVVVKLIRLVKLTKDDGDSTSASSQISLLAGDPSPQTDAHHIVPKGLRSFDAHDADFFLELLPGPRNREGLPDSIRFWKLRVEELDAARSFAVGLIYGPSGCGKSSLVKAGLLPRLSDNITTLYVEATAAETEIRLLHGLRKKFPALPADLNLKESVAALRQGQAIAAGEKVLIVLDQFEQWLHAHKDGEDTELVQTLRQCDGGRVQCIIMVRDDFWLAISRFLRDLEIRIIEGENSALVDLFDIEHAKKVLIAFGRAFGRLPENSAEIGIEAHQFLTQTVSGLSQEGKIISVRLALFAEMMKGRPWTLASLKEVGGTEGVGITFLEETFSASNAPLERRYHQNAARLVLKCLLPESGTNIKGHMRSYAELLEASGYASRPRDFDDLIHILDSEVRLLTPTDPEGMTGADGTAAPPKPGNKFFQLTHDYLVPALRDWLTRKQKETRRGRAELLLADRASVWNSRPENRQLPSFLQWVSILVLTAQNLWTPLQRKMMRHATRYHTIRAAAICSVFIGITFAGLWIQRFSSRHQDETISATLVSQLVNADPTQVPSIIKEMHGYRHWVDPLLVKRLGVAPNLSREKLNISLALLPEDSSQVDFLYQRVFAADPDEVAIIRDALYPYRDELLDRLWSTVQTPEKNSETVRLRAAALLASYDPNSEKWSQVSTPIAADLVQENPFFLVTWGEAFRPVKNILVPALTNIFRDARPERASERNLATNFLADYAGDQAQVLADLLMESDERQFAIIFPKFRQQAAQGLPLLASETERKLSLTADDNEARRQANAAAALLLTNQPSPAWSLMKGSADPRVRTYLIHRLSSLGADPSTVINRLAAEPDVSIRRALILSLGEFDAQALPEERRKQLIPKLQAFYRTAADPGLHAAVEWLLRAWQQDPWLQQVNDQWARDGAQRDRKLEQISGLQTDKASASSLQWYVDGQDNTMVVIPGPVEFLMGSPPGEAHREDNETPHHVRIKRTVAIAAMPVTFDQFKAFDPKYDVLPSFRRVPRLPVIAVSWYQAAAYCNWLSRREHIPEDQLVYAEKNGLITGMKPNYLELTGYRLPTEAEMEYALRSGAATSRYYGETETLLPKYAWYNADSDDLTWPVGMKMPSDMGLFDILGNVWSWSQDEYKPYPASAGGAVIDDKEGDLTISATASRVLRGGSFNYEGKYLRSAYRYNYVPTNRNQHYGFRVVRTLNLQAVSR